MLKKEEEEEEKHPRGHDEDCKALQTGNAKAVFALSFLVQIYSFRHGERAFA